MCYNCNEDKIKPIGSFLNVITNESGHRFYIMSYHFYQKVDYFTFHKRYDSDPVKEYFQFKKIINSFNTTDNKKSKINETLEKNLQICTKFINNDYTYVPFAACLVSKYPFAKQMEQCLESIVRMMVDIEINNQSEEFNKLISYFMNGIPIPPLNKKLMFYIPYSPTPVEIAQRTYKDLPVINYSLKYLFDFFSIENIIIIHHLIILENKLLFISDDYTLIPKITEAFLNILHPFDWVNTYIPIISEEMIKYLQSFMPFVMGMHESMFNMAKQFFDDETTVYLIFIKKNYIDVSTNKKNKKQNKKSILYIFK